MGNYIFILDIFEVFFLGYIFLRIYILLYSDKIIKVGIVIVLLIFKCNNDWE